MKPIKLGSLAVAAALTLGAFGVKAAPPTTTDYLKLSFAMTVQQQALYDTNRNGDGKTYIWTTKTTKIGNKELLKMLAEMFEETNWPAGAQLEYDFNSRQVVVADKTGTNVLFYCGDGVDDATHYAYLYFDPYKHSGPFTQKYIDAAPGSYVWTEYCKGEFELYYDSLEDETTYASFYYGYGQNTRKGTEKWNASNIGTWTENEIFTPVSNGSVDGGHTAQITGKVKAKGKSPFPREE
jgi:hypothetical protein